MAGEEPRLPVDEPPRWRRLFDLVPDALVVSDRSGMATTFNRAAMRLLVDGSGHRTRRSLTLLVSREDTSAFLQLLDKVGPVPSAPRVMSLREGPARGTVVEVTAVLADAASVLWNFRDVTAREEAKQLMELALAREAAAAHRLQEVDDIRRAFLLGVAHDLRSPLSAIAGLAETMQQTELDPPERAKALHHIEERARETMAVLGDLLDYERFQAEDAQTLVRTPVDVAALVSAQAAEVPLAGQHLEIATRAAVASVDAGLLRRAVANLVRNAAQHTPASTTIWVRCSAETDGILLVVEDDGPGVDPDLRPTVFDPFARGPRTGTGAGLGLGLSLVRRFAVLHGGWARLEERSGGGASFQVLFPGGET